MPSSDESFSKGPYIMPRVPSSWQKYSTTRPSHSSPRYFPPSASHALSRCTAIGLPAAEGRSRFRSNRSSENTPGERRAPSCAPKTGRNTARDSLPLRGEFLSGSARHLLSARLRQELEDLVR